MDLLEPGEREVRNPRIVLAFRRIGLSEHAGWGLPDVFWNWQQLGHVPPLVSSDRRRKSFELILKKEAVLSDRQIVLQRSLGLGLMDEEARTFALACREQHVRLWQIKAVTGLSGPDAAAVANQLVKRTLIERIGSDRYVLARHLADRLARSDQVSARADDMDSDQVGPSRLNRDTEQTTRQMTTHQRRIIDACDVPRSLVDLTKRAGVTHRTFFRRKHLQPLVDAGIVRMTNPDKQNAANQRYVLTEAGAAIKAARIRTSAYKTNGGLEDRYPFQAGTADSAWDFVRGWQKHERMIELSAFLEQNFLRYDGRGEVPRQIHAYLSGNFKELRNLPKNAVVLRAKAKDRWYVPDRSSSPTGRGICPAFRGG